MVKKNATLRERRQELINQHFDLNANQRPFFDLNIYVDDPFTQEEKDAMAKQEDIRKEISKLDEKIGNKILWKRT
ncbi:MAG: hypothetical protein ACFE9L_21010 [Candidatus Hodarchaeota archaeon]